VEDQHQHHGDGAKAIDIGTIKLGRQGQWRTIRKIAEQAEGIEASLALMPSLAGPRSTARGCPPSDPNRDFPALENSLESRFFASLEAALKRLEKKQKNTTYSTACGDRLCAGRDASFMAQMV
jgi:hypothetical protein